MQVKFSAFVLQKLFPIRNNIVRERERESEQTLVAGSRSSISEPHRNFAGLPGSEWKSSKTASQEMISSTKLLLLLFLRLMKDIVLSNLQEQSPHVWIQIHWIHTGNSQAQILVAALQETAFVPLKVLEGMSQRHGDLVLSRFGINIKRLRERGCIHHTGMLCLLAVVKPDAQGEAWAASWVL